MTDAELDEIYCALIKPCIDKFRNRNRAIAKYALKIQNLSAGEKSSIYEMVQFVHETVMPLLGDDETVSGLIGKVRDRYGKFESELSQLKTIESSPNRYYRACVVLSGVVRAAANSGDLLFALSRVYYEAIEIVVQKPKKTGLYCDGEEQAEIISGWKEVIEAFHLLSTALGDCSTVAIVKLLGLPIGKIEVNGKTQQDRLFDFLFEGDGNKAVFRTKQLKRLKHSIDALGLRRNLDQFEQDPLQSLASVFIKAEELFEMESQYGYGLIIAGVAKYSPITNRIQFANDLSRALNSIERGEPVPQLEQPRDAAEIRQGYVDCDDIAAIDTTGSVGAAAKEETEGNPREKSVKSKKSTKGCLHPFRLGDDLLEVMETPIGCICWRSLKTGERKSCTITAGEPVKWLNRLFDQYSEKTNIFCTGYSGKVPWIRLSASRWNQLKHSPHPRGNGKEFFDEIVIKGKKESVKKRQQAENPAEPDEYPVYINPKLFKEYTLK